jgi:3-oxoacyl-[acyl-carrier-protein] synthase-1
MSGRIYITGTGVISAIGNNVARNFASLEQQRSGIGPITILDTAFKKDFVAGEVKYTNAQLAKMVGISADLEYPRNTLLGIIAAREAFIHARISNTESLRTGLIAGTTVGGMDKTERFYYHLDRNQDFIHSHSCGSITGQIADYLGLNHFVTTFNTACSSSANAIMHGARLINHGILDRAIVGGFDSLSRFTLNGFRSLFILSPDPCKPFDKNRTGLNLGEGAGFLVLESEQTLEHTGNEPICRLTGYANTNDAFHQTASSENGEGAYLCMKNALKMAGLKPGEIDYINLHGTGTENNDLSEAMAINRVFGNDLPPFSSTKSYTGHTLGAAGGIEAVFAVLSLQHKVLFPNLGFKTPMDPINLVPITHTMQLPGISNLMSNSFGFGGNDTTLIFSKN